METTIDFSRCDKYHKCGVMHEDMTVMEDTLNKIEKHLGVSAERFKWLERAGWGLGLVTVALVGYMITMSITSYNRDSALQTNDAVQNEKLKNINSNVNEIKSLLKGE